MSDKPDLRERIQRFQEPQWKRFNETTGALSGGNTHPDRCICQKDDRTPHKHYAEEPHSCARCGRDSCPGYRSYIPADLSTLLADCEAEIADLQRQLAEEKARADEGWAAANQEEANHADCQRELQERDALEAQAADLIAALTESLIEQIAKPALGGKQQQYFAQAWLAARTPKAEG